MQRHAHENKYQFIIINVREKQSYRLNLTPALYDGSLTFTNNGHKWGWHPLFNGKFAIFMCKNDTIVALTPTSTLLFKVSGSAPVHIFIKMHIRYCYL